MFGSIVKTVGAVLLTMPLVTGAFAAAPSVPNVLYAAHYSPGLMEKVAARRKMQRVDCMISSPWHPLNTWIRLESQKNGEVAYCRTTDVSAPVDKARHKRLQIIELDWVTAQRLCEVRRVAAQSPRNCPVRIEVVTEQAALAALAPAPPAVAPPVVAPEPLPAAPPQPQPTPEAPPTSPAEPAVLPMAVAPTALIPPSTPPAQ